jgi:peptidoglycan/xylan/chitin deacetylase (PgdA/CDA1 family)
MRFVHAAPRLPPPAPTSLAELCAGAGTSYLRTAAVHAPEALRFVAELSADLGVVYGTGILKPALFALPRLGSINVHKRKLPDYRGGGPVGLWELLAGEREIGVSVHQVTEQLDGGAVIAEATIPIEPFDGLTSLALKAHVVGNDLIVRAIRELAAGTARPRVQTAGGRSFRSPEPHELARLAAELARRRPAYRAERSRPVAKLLLRSSLAAPLVTARNWHRRLRRSFPVLVLFHHVVTDRPHRMGLSTERFLEHVAYLRRHYRIASLGDAVEALRRGRVDAPTVVLTFDDGYADNFLSLRAVVERTGIPITLFVSTDHVLRGLEFEHDVRRGTRGFAPLSWEQLAQLRREGFEIGSHTRTHFDCGTADLAALEREIVGSREELERRLGGEVRCFSFPFGRPENVSREAFALACRTYPLVLSACGGNNFAPRDGAVAHLRRRAHANSLWDLELQLQGVLEREPRFPPQAWTRP